MEGVSALWPPSALSGLEVDEVREALSDPLNFLGQGVGGVGRAVAHAAPAGRGPIRDKFLASVSRVQARRSSPGTSWRRAQIRHTRRAASVRRAPGRNDAAVFNRCYEPAP